MAGAAAAPLAFCRQASAKATEELLPPVRAITSGPRYHWFGYYDKFQFDVTGRFVLGLEVDFEHRLPQPDDIVTVGMIDL